MNTKQSNPKDLVGVRKVPMSTVSAAVMAEVGVAMLEGAAKYGRHNYRAVGVRSSVYYDSTMRHLMAWWEGEDVDADSGMSHVTKAITSLVVLRDAMIQGMCTDDRPPSSAEFYAALNAKAEAILDKYADRDPCHYTIADTRVAASEQCGQVERKQEGPQSIWSRAPNWAEWVAMDKDGRWHWYEDEPRPGDASWITNLKRVSEVGFEVATMEDDWTRTLSSRH